MRRLVLSGLLAVVLLSALVFHKWNRAAPSAESPSVPTAASTQPIEPEMGPYMMNVTQTSAEVLWVTAPETKPTSKLEINPVANVDLQTRPLPAHPDTLHIAKLTGLDAGKTYHYTVVFFDGVNKLGETTGEFQTAPSADSTAPLKFAVYGDTRTFPDRHRQVAAALDTENPLAFVLHSGDLCSSGLVWPLWKKEFFDPAHDLLRHTVMWPVLGNHERDGVLCSALFDLPGRYYSFDYGNAHIAAIDSEMNVNTRADPTMLAWLEQDLNSSKAMWKLVYYHRPSYDIVSDRSTWGQDELTPIFEKTGVDMVFNGHDHVYERFRPIGEPGKKPFIVIVSAGGGAPSYPISPSPILERNYSGIHYCLYTITGNTLEMTAKLSDGTILDQLKLIKTNGQFQKQITDRTVTAKFARDTSNLLSGFFADIPAYPVAGNPVTLSVSPMAFPEGAKVEISTAASPISYVPNRPLYTQFTVPPVTLTAWKGRPEADEPASRPAMDPITFTAIAPTDLEPPSREFFRSPTIHVSLRVTYMGQTYTSEDVPVLLSNASARRFSRGTSRPAAQ